MAERQAHELVTWGAVVNLGPLQTEGAVFDCPTLDALDIAALSGETSEEIRAAALRADGRSYRADLLQFTDEGFHAVQVVDIQTGERIMHGEHQPDLRSCGHCHISHIVGSAVGQVSIDGGRVIRTLDLDSPANGLSTIIEPAGSHSASTSWRARLRINPSTRHMSISATGVANALGPEARASITVNNTPGSIVGPCSASLRLFTIGDKDRQLDAATLRFGENGVLKVGLIDGQHELIDRLGWSQNVTLGDSTTARWIHRAAMEAVGRSEGGDSAIDLRLTAAALYATLNGVASDDPTSRIVFAG